MTVKKSVKKPETVDCITLKKIGLSDEETSGIGEKVKLPKETAKKLQDAGAVKVAL